MVVGALGFTESLWFSGGLMASVANEMGTKVMVRLVRDSFG